MQAEALAMLARLNEINTLANTLSLQLAQASAERDRLVVEAITAGADPSYVAIAAGMNEFQVRAIVATTPAAQPSQQHAVGM